MATLTCSIRKRTKSLVAPTGITTTRLDPNVAIARCRLSRLESWMFYAIEPLPARAQKARAAADEALRLQPDLPESHLAMGYVRYYIDRDYDAALRSEE